MQIAGQQEPLPAQRICPAIAAGTEPSLVILLELMADRTDADQRPANFKRCDESGVAERDDQFALPVVHRAGGFAA